MADFGITGYGAYVPYKRIPRQAIFNAVGWAQGGLKGLAKGARAYAQWDEDSVTMSVAACRAALEAFPDAASSSSLPAALCFASTTAPFLDRQNAGIVATALDLPAATHCYDTSGSQRAAVSPLTGLAQNQTGNLTVVAADRRPTASASVMEMLAGDGAACVTIGSNADVLAELVDAQAVYADFVDHYRTAGTETDYLLEERWVRDAGLTQQAPQAVQPLLERHGLSPADIHHLIVPVPNAALARPVAACLGISKEALADGLFAQCGHTGAAHPLMMLTQVLDNAAAGEWILLCAFGQGFEAVLLKTTDALVKKRGGYNLQHQLDAGVEDENYIKFLSAGGKIDIDWGMRAERDNRTAQTVAFAKSRDIYGFVGGLCSACGTPQFPKARRCVNPDCGALDTQSDYPFADKKALVKSFTEDWMAFTRQPPLVYGNVSFEGGGNVFIEMTDMEPGDIAIGSLVRMQFRIKDIDNMRGFHRYFWKAAPVPDMMAEGKG